MEMKPYIDPVDVFLIVSRKRDSDATKAAPVSISFSNANNETNETLIVLKCGNISFITFC